MVMHLIFGWINANTKGSILVFVYIDSLSMHSFIYSILKCIILLNFLLIHKLLKIILLLRTDPLTRTLFGWATKFVCILILIVGSQCYICFANYFLF